MNKRIFGNNPRVGIKDEDVDYFSTLEKMSPPELSDTILPNYSGVMIDFGTSPNSGTLPFNDAYTFLRVHQRDATKEERLRFYEQI